MLQSFLQRYEQSLEISNRRESPLRSIAVVVGLQEGVHRRVGTWRTR